MLVKNFHDLPQELQCEAVRPYFEILNQRRTSLLCKSIFDRVMAAGLLITLSPVFLILAIMIKRDSAGEVFFRQTRVTQYGRTFGIYKFRTMVKNAESLGAQVTSQNDMRVTKVGNMLRSCRLDELPQLINILLGLRFHPDSDEGGGDMCRNPLALASALAKIDYYSKHGALPNASNATAHMFIINPMMGIGESLGNLFSTHPRTEERIQKLKKQAMNPKYKEKAIL